jgi:Ca-activated chloride channel family protein
MRIRFGRRQSKKATLAILSVIAALGAVLLLRPPAPAAAGPRVTTPRATPSVDVPSVTAVGSAQAELDGPAIDGVFAFGEGALLASGSPDVYAELRLTGLAPEGTVPRSPVALAVVLDHSGSMSGEKMRQAEEAVVALLSRMHDEDYLSVIVYDDSAEILQPLAPVSALRASLPSLIRGVSADGGTNIPLGIDLGVSALASAPSGLVRRLVLMSDGIDGSGQSLAAIEAQISTRASDRLTTSALGIGIDYDERFMNGVAEAGRGNYAFLEREDQLAPFLTRELEQATSTVADSVVASIDLPAGLSLVRAHGAVAEQSGSTVRIPIGTLFAGERRKVVLHLSSTAGAVGTSVATAVQLDYRTRDSAPHVLSGIASVARVATDTEVASARDEEIWGDAVATVLDAQQDDALTAWREGRRADALAMTDANLAALASAQHAAPRAAPMLAARAQSRTEERALYEADSADSASGRAGGLRARSARVDMAEAF